MTETARRILCRVGDIPDGGAKGFPPPKGGFTGLFAVRRGKTVLIYINACPHLGVPLDWAPDRFLSTDASHIVCSTHGAMFDIASGECLRGPCLGDHLEAIPFRIEDGMLTVDERAGL